MNKTLKLCSTWVILILITGCKPSTPSTSVVSDPIEDFINLRFGMFLCYNIMSYGANWGEANFDISGFNPEELDCKQWARAAKSANMTFGLLTTKHHEGFCLWDSQVTEYDVASTPYQRDIVRQYVEAFRDAELKIGLYYSIWDSTHGIDKGEIGEEEMAFIKTQIKELLTNYGKIDYFVLDGWFWRMGHQEVPYTEIREWIRELQPDCLVTDHTHLQAPYHVDIPYFEGPFGAFPAAGNKMPSALGHCSFPGNGWFWNEQSAKGLRKGESTTTIVAKLDTLEERYCNFLLNCMPNRDGVLDTVVTDLLADIGNNWSPDQNRPTWSADQNRLIQSVPVKSVTASSGEANRLIDAMQYGTEYKHWVAQSDSLQVITLDLGTPQLIDRLILVPNHRCKPIPEMSLSKGNPLRVSTYVSNDNLSFRKVATDRWPINADYRSIRFPETDARFIQLHVHESVEGPAIIAEIEIGLSRIIR